MRKTIFKTGTQKTVKKESNVVFPDRMLTEGEPEAFFPLNNEMFAQISHE